MRRSCIFSHTNRVLKSSIRVTKRNDASSHEREGRAAGRGPVCKNFDSVITAILLHAAMGTKGIPKLLYVV